MPRVGVRCVACPELVETVVGHADPWEEAAHATATKSTRSGWRDLACAAVSALAWRDGPAATDIYLTAAASTSTQKQNMATALGNIGRGTSTPGDSSPEPDALSTHQNQRVQASGE